MYNSSQNNTTTPLLGTVQNDDLTTSLLQTNINDAPKKRAFSDNMIATHRVSHYAVPFVPIIPDVGVGLIEEDSPQHKRTSILSEVKKGKLTAIFMLCSISLGVGVFVLPEVFNITGIGTGILMLIGFAAMSTFTQLISIDIAISLDCYSYEELAFKSMGRLGEFLLAFFMMLSLLIGNCAHILTVGQLLHDIIEWFYTDETGVYEFNWKKTGILYCVMLSLTIPWLFQKNLHGLSGVGTLSVCVVLITAVSLILNCFSRMIEGNYAKGSDAPDFGFNTPLKGHFWTTDFWRAAPTFAFVYTSLLELFPVFNEINNRNASQTKSAITISSIICLFIYLTVGVIVIVTFGNNVESNSLYNIPSDNYWITFCCFVLVIVITLLYPVINYPMINAIETMLDMIDYCKRASSSSQNLETEPTTIKKFPTSPTGLWHWIIFNRRSVISVIGIIIVISIDIGITDLVDLFGLCGSLGLSFICYIFPCLIYLITQWKQLSWSSWKLWTAIGILIFSTTIMIYSTTVIMINLL